MSASLSEIQDAIDRFDFDTARNLLREAFKNPTAETYYLASQVALDEEQKVRLLQKSVESDPSFEKAISALAKAGISQNKEIISSKTSLTRSEESISSRSSVGKQVNSEKQYITAKTKDKPESLFRFPIPEAPTRTSLPPYSQLVIFERTESNRWLNVFYVGSTNEPIFGWIPTSNVEDIQLNNKQINVMDFPITNFDYNSRDDVVDLLSSLNKLIAKRNIVVFVTTMFFMTGCVSAGVASDLLASNSDLGIFGVAIALIALAVGSNRFLACNKEFSEIYISNLGWSGHFIEYMNRLERLRKGKQDIVENQMEHQAIMQANQIAGGILTKLTPEFKDVVNLTKGK